ncbi:MAG: hypothetical protein M3N51_09830 [Actinomycetota bacterium]|nr:hypothetical protein [Actinomycetota bacterium]
MSAVDLLIALAIGVVIFRLGLGAVRLLASPAPEPDPQAVVPVQLDYRCSLCGTRVTMTHLSEEKAAAPKHCREEMEPVA